MSSDTPTFLGFVDAAGSWKFDQPEQVRDWLKHLAGGIGEEIEVTIAKRRQDRSSRQNRGFHAMISPWATGRGWEIEALKQFLLKKVFGVLEFVDPTSGEVTEILAEPHTSKLTKAQFSELIERTLEIAIEDGYRLLAPGEYRHARDYERTPS